MGVLAFPGASVVSYATVVAETATSLRRGIAILFALEGEASQDGGLGVTRIAELLGREKSQVSRSLKILAQYGLVERDPETRGYRLGGRLFAIAARSGQATLAAAAAPFLKRLVSELGETAHLSLLQGAEVMTILSESPNRAVQAASWVGRTVPVYCTSSGRPLLFDHDRDAVAALLAGAALDATGPNAPSDVDDLLKRIEAARRRGFAVVDEEFEPGLVAAGAPVRDFTGRVVAAVNVSAPKFRLGHRLDAAGASVKAAADELSRRVGWLAGGHGRTG